MQRALLGCGFVAGHGAGCPISASPRSSCKKSWRSSSAGNTDSWIRRTIGPRAVPRKPARGAGPCWQLVGVSKGGREAALPHGAWLGCDSSAQRAHGAVPGAKSELLQKNSSGFGHPLPCASQQGAGQREAHPMPTCLGFSGRCLGAYVLRVLSASRKLGPDSASALTACGCFWKCL